jgi:Kinesin motor domain
MTAVLLQVCTSSVVKDVWNGLSSHVIAFGGSGTGRSFTLFGRRLTSVSDGIIQRITRRLFLLGALRPPFFYRCLESIGV